MLPKAQLNLPESCLKDLRVAEVVKLDMTIEDGKIASFRTRLTLFGSKI